MSEDYIYNFKTLDMTFEIICQEFFKMKEFKSYCIFNCSRITIRNYFENKPLFEKIKTVEDYDNIKNYLELKHHFYIKIYEISVNNWTALNEVLKFFVFEKIFKFERPADILAVKIFDDFHRWKQSPELSKYKAKTFYLAKNELAKSSINKEITPECLKLINRLKKKSLQKDRFTVMDVIKGFLLSHKYKELEVKDTLLEQYEVLEARESSLDEYLFERLRGMF